MVSTKRANAIVYDVIVIGGGASGLFAAGRAAELGKRVLLLEKNKRLGQKLAISGGGRCNITNAEEDEKKLLQNYGTAEKFLYSAFAQFGMKDTFTFFEKRGLPLIVQARQRAFPHTEKAADVVRVLTDYLTQGRVEVRLNKSVDRIRVKGGTIQSVISGNEEYVAQSYIMATGGVSHPETGSTGDGFTWLKEMGHTVVQPTPTIVPLSVKESWPKQLQGKTLPNSKITFYLSKDAEVPKKQFSRTGDILLTHFGLSGPTILNLAGEVADLLYEGVVTARIDLYAQLDIGALDAHILELFAHTKNKLVQNVFRELVPPGTAEALLALTGVDPETKVHSVTKEDRRKIIDVLKALPITIKGLLGFDRAVVADGGVVLTEVAMRTMRSTKIENLLVTGDLLNISRPSGGYSLQLCWTTGFVAGTNA